jgi:geranylgeranyl pyrophosphate synthase
VIFASAAQLAADTGSNAVMQVFAETLSVVVNGEITNMFTHREGASRAGYYHWISAQSAAMFELASGAAAILGSNDQDVIDAARQFGRSIGMALRIVEDVLAFDLDPADGGKPAASDLRQGIVTLPALYYFEAHPDDPEVRSFIERNGHDESSLDRLITAIRQSEAVSLSMHEAAGYVQRGLETLSQLPQSPERYALEQLASGIASTRSPKGAVEQGGAR